MSSSDQHISKDGVIVIKAQAHRSQDENRQEALGHLAELVKEALVVPKKGKATRPIAASKRKHLDEKTRRRQLRTMRAKITP